ncbi:MAG TPA: TetR/AcrR family transcriptional regulator C-terminal domain-containing protein [Stackebrandtia sp.]|uniref:TetR/AcrR family transcriptional regulator C-terminal domain-containing protein n=1 Tax=Stackebrandtia sp. TaxID=2023065 RepID=UPI002D64D5B1|nr:TetR/AcrR family transcriptional regulator C-terminal domain-containing protein [Stackebrandtia sp.]HZE37760.1 TetR/AcrR family transcriptional regulator C-terminal domain-containing protein [Stackebrandtia sp.]
MKLNSEVIADAALKLIDEVGLDGLTMRLVAKELGVQAPALYWHVKNKRELLDAMADRVFTAAITDVEAPRRGDSWQDWLAEGARRTRRAMLAHRDGGRMLAGTSISDPAMFRVVELSLRTLQDNGFTLKRAAQAVPILLHFTIGFTIEQQSREGVDYSEDNPYRPEAMSEILDARRYPLMTEAGDAFVNPDFDEDFEFGLRVILAGLTAID